MDISCKQSTNLSSSLNTFICSSCKKDILNLSIIGMEVYSRCSCSNKEVMNSLFSYIDHQIEETKPEFPLCKIHSITTEKYCPICYIWLCPKCITDHSLTHPEHILIEYELAIKCKQHGLTYSMFCEKCKLNLCNECIVNHKKHKRIAIPEVNLSSIDMKTIINLYNKNKQLIRELINERYSQYGTARGMIHAHYRAQNGENQKLLQFYQKLLDTALLLKGYPIYQIAKLINLFKFNTIEYNRPENQNTNETAKLIRNYNGSYYILIQDYSQQTQDIINLIGHTTNITSIIQLTDGRLASCSMDNTIKLWDLTSNQCTTTLEGHRDGVLCLIQLKDGRLASGSFDKSIKLWDLSTNQRTVTLTGHKKRVGLMIQLQDGRLASVHEAIKLWDLTTNQCCISIPIRAGVMHLLQLHDGRLLININYVSIQLWDVTTCQSTATVKLNRWHMHSIIQLSDSRLAFIVNNDIIELWNPITFQSSTRLKVQTGNIDWVFQLNNNIFASLARHHFIKLWDLKTNQLIAEIVNEEREMTKVIQLNDGRIAVVAFDTIQLWLP